MKKISSEFSHNYKTYSFGYANYCVRDAGDKLHSIYSRGYLPYSGSPGVKDIFYMARSSRVPLESFSLSSENRRIAKKFDGLLIRKTIPFDKFDVNADFYKFCIDYFLKRHGPLVMPEKRLKTILISNIITNIVSYSKNGELVAYFFEVSDKFMAHYWYSFYDLSYAYQSLGMWLMLDSVRQAKEENKKYYYIGTVYGEKALYKTAFKNLEYWNGDFWSSDMKTLKKLSRSDEERNISLSDLWKEDKELF